MTNSDQKFLFFPGERSAVIIRPKPAFLDFLRSRPDSLISRYCSEEDGVWIVPAIERLGSAEALLQFVDAYKPRMLRAELERFGNVDRRFPDVDFSKETFDAFFDLELKDYVSEINQLDDPS